jgi:DNA-binding NtrC family response regulator
MLIAHLQREIASEQGNTVKKFSADAIKLLQEYDWTGNIRELRNVVEFDYSWRKPNFRERREVLLQ